MAHIDLHTTTAHAAAGTSLQLSHFLRKSGQKEPDANEFAASMTLRISAPSYEVKQNATFCNTFRQNLLPNPAPRVSRRLTLLPSGAIVCRGLRTALSAHAAPPATNLFTDDFTPMTDTPAAPRQLASIDYFGKRAGRYRESHGDLEALELLVRMASPRGDEFVLDVGAGPGHLACAFARHVRQVVASDVTMLMLRELPIVMRDRHVSGVWPVAADAQALPFADELFDVVTSRLAAAHFPDHPGAVREMARVCKTGGIVLVADSMGPEDPEARAYVDELEWLRDSSHGSNHSFTEWNDAYRGGRAAGGAGLRHQRPHEVAGELDGPRRHSAREPRAHPPPDRERAGVAQASYRHRAGRRRQPILHHRANPHTGSQALGRTFGEWPANRRRYQPLKKDLMDILVCPLCRGDLDLTVDRREGDEIVEGSLSCSACPVVFPIEDTIPNLLPPELRV